MVRCPLLFQKEGDNILKALIFSRDRPGYKHGDKPVATFFKRGLTIKKLKDNAAESYSLKKKLPPAEGKKKEEFNMENQQLGITKAAIMHVLMSLQLKYGKAYCFPTQKTILALLLKCHQIDIQRRALNYHLRDLVNLGLITRTRRIRKNPAGGLIFNSTLYFLKNLGYRFLEKIKHYGQKIEIWAMSNQANRSQRRAAARGHLIMMPDGETP